jgi:uncharacterized coiled-coil protein SlyX
MDSLVAQDWRDERIAELEATLLAKDARLAELEQQVAQLKGQVAELAKKLGQNSHRPPSADPPGVRKRRKDKAKGKGKGKSQRGNLFPERLMTVAHTARKQKRGVLAFLTACCQTQSKQTPAPSLFDAEVTAAG